MRDNTPRPTIDQYFIAMTSLVSSRSTCARRAVGCVLVDERKHVLATGYNGVAAGQPHCHGANPSPCGAAASAASGTNLDGCQAIHAEMNALIQCRDSYAIDTCYVTVSPCITCTKLLLATSCSRIVASADYADAKASRDLWLSAGRRWSILAVD